MVPFQISPLPLVRDTPAAITDVTPTLSLAFTVTKISSPVFGLVVFSVTEWITGSVVSEASSVIL